MNPLEEQLSKKFPKSEIVTLEYVTSKISMVSNVRVGKKENRKFTNYDEVGLNNIDRYGFVYVSDKAKIQEPASNGVMKAQSLNYGDILMVQRGKTGKIAMVNKKKFYKKVIVGNNSMIRLQFSQEQLKASFHHLVFHYLQLPFVKEYIESYIPSSSSYDRKILNSTALSEIMIPFIKYEDRDLLLNFLSTRQHILLQADEIKNNIEKLLLQYQDSQNNILDDIFNNDTNQCSDKLDSDMQSLETLVGINDKLVEAIDNDKEIQKWKKGAELASKNKEYIELSRELS